MVIPGTIAMNTRKDLVPHLSQSQSGELRMSLANSPKVNPERHYLPKQSYAEIPYRSIYNIDPYRLHWKCWKCSLQEYLFWQKNQKDRKDISEAITVSEAIALI